MESKEQGNIYTYGSQPSIRAKVSNNTTASRALNLLVRTTDFDDRTVHEAIIPVAAAPGRTTTATIPCGVVRKGFYRLHVKCDDACVVPAESIRFAVIEPYENQDSIFGMNHAYPWPHLLDLSGRIGLRWFRDWSLKWHDVEPEKGRFEFDRPDEQIERVLERGLKVLPLLPFPSSYWASSADPASPRETGYAAGLERVARMPQNLDDFAAYVEATVRHYTPRLRHWEILNEPIYTQYALPRAKGYEVKDYVELLRTAYGAVKKADPDAFVIGGIAGNPDRYTREFIEQGGLQWVDALNIHTYPGLTPPEAYDEPLRQLRRRMLAAGGNKPIWFTEGAYYADDDMAVEPFDSTWLKPVDSESTAAEYLVKFNAILLAHGTEKIIYHSGTPGSLNDDSPSGIFFEWAGAPRKMLTAQAAMANLLSPPIQAVDLPRPREDIFTCGFETHGQIVVVAWMKAGKPPVDVRLGKSLWLASDLQGNEMTGDKVRLTERPVYFTRHGRSLTDMPWD